MNNTIDSILHFMEYLMFPGFFFIIIGMGLVLPNLFPKKNIKEIRIGIIILALAIFIFFTGFGIQNIFRNKIRHDLVNYINNNKNQIQVVINDTINVNAEVYLYYLKQTSNSEAHHSHYLKRIKVNLISKNQSWQISLAQDSDYKNEFWVFVDDYKISTQSEIGRIHSSALNYYLLKLNLIDGVE